MFELENKLKHVCSQGLVPDHNGGAYRFPQTVLNNQISGKPLCHPAAGVEFPLGPTSATSLNNFTDNLCHPFERLPCKKLTTAKIVHCK